MHSVQLDKLDWGKVRSQISSCTQQNAAEGTHATTAAPNKVRDAAGCFPPQLFLVSVPRCQGIGTIPCIKLGILLTWLIRQVGNDLECHSPSKGQANHWQTHQQCQTMGTKPGLLCISFQPVIWLTCLGSLQQSIEPK